MTDEGDRDKMSRERAAKNRRLAIVLGLIAVAIYVIFIMGYAH
ncbi:MAG: hypothetical protein ACREUU_15220 [Gammaproteobacteria bacterium]